MSLKKNIALNGSVSIITQIVKVLLTFVNRKIFICYLGIFYIGLNNLFGSILNMLSLAELGVGIAITYALHKPLVGNSLGKVKTYMRLYARIYHIIATVILCLGLLLIPFLHIFLKETPINGEILTIYLLMLSSSVISYFFSYRSALIVANQKNYLLQMIELISFIVVSLLQWIGLWMVKSIILYLLLEIVCRFATNLVIVYFAKKEVDLSHVEEIPLTIVEKQSLKDNILGTMMSSLAIMIVFQTDSLLISYFAGIIVLGLYSNYILISSALGTIGVALESVVPSIRDLIIRHEHRKIKLLYEKIMYWNFLISYLTSLGFYALASDAIVLWLGEQYKIAPLYVFLIALSKFISAMRAPNLKFSSAYGLFSRHKVKCIVEAIVNLVMSLLLAGVFQLGLAGVLLGTILSSLLIASGWETIIVYRYGFKESSLKYLPLILKESITWLVGLGVIIFISHRLVFKITIWTFCLKGLAIFLLLMLVFVIFYIRDSETKNNIRFLKNKLLRKVAGER